jgi:23S rRNA pseudouridine1911/1915/1917 synthase
VRHGWAASRRAASELISSGRVRVNGRRYRKGEPIAAGDRVEVAGLLASEPLAPNPDLKIEILSEDAAAIVADKPALLPCHPLHPHERRTVMNAIVAAYPETANTGDKPFEGGLVHRLDNGTSGALMIARNREAFAAMREALRTGRVKRRYRALAAGHIGGATEIATPIAHHAKNSRKMVVVATPAVVNSSAASPQIPRHRSTPRAAFTTVEPLSYENGFTLVQVAPRTGSRHQIRVHLASIGHPLAGDDLYGGPPLAGLAPGRFWLHLAELEFESPAGGRVQVASPIARDLSDCLALLRSRSGSDADATLTPINRGRRYRPAGTETATRR